MSSKSVEFFFRVWVHPEDGDPADIETWFHGFESVKPGTRYVSEWARDSLSNEDFNDIFGLDKTRHWQVIGKCRLSGCFDCYGEYDETLDVLDFEKSEVPEEWFGFGDDLVPVKFA